MRRPAAFALLVFGLVCLRSQAAGTSFQEPPAPTTVAAAEAEGAKYPKPDGRAVPARGYGTAFGPTDRKCVDAETHAAARSGQFVAGTFEDHIIMGNSGRRKVWWAPLQTEIMPPMLLRAAKTSAPDKTVAWTFPSVVHNINGYFFNTEFMFPEAGKWLVVVTSGDNWGCFLLDQN